MTDLFSSRCPTRDAEVDADRRPPQADRIVAAALFAVCGRGFVMLYPLIWLVGASFKTNAEIFSSPGFMPRNPTARRLYQGLEDLDALHFRDVLLEHVPDHRCRR